MTLKEIMAQEDAMMGRKGKILDHATVYHKSCGQVRIVLADYTSTVRINEEGERVLPQQRLFAYTEDGTGLISTIVGQKEPA